MNKASELGVKYPTLSSIENFRDLGGIEIGTRRIIDNKIFRSGAIYGLSEEQKADFDKLNIKHIVDFRVDGEIAKQPDYVPRFCDYVNLPVTDDDSSMAHQKDIAERLRRGKVEDFQMLLDDLISSYRQTPFQDAYKKMFAIMDSGDSFLFHCVAGKDRTGVASMLILLALGADYKTAKEDYMLSNLYRKKIFDEFSSQLANYYTDQRIIDILGKTMAVAEELLDASFDEINKRYSSIDEFFLKVYNADKARREKWVALYTE